MPRFLDESGVFCHRCEVAVVLCQPAQAAPLAQPDRVCQHAFLRERMAAESYTFSRPLEEPPAVVVVEICQGRVVCFGEGLHPRIIDSEPRPAAQAGEVSGMHLGPLQRGRLLKEPS